MDNRKYFGSAMMVGKDAGVQEILREIFKKDLQFHWTFHKSNLVVSDSKWILELRNCNGTFQVKINFFSELILR